MINELKRVCDARMEPTQMPLESQVGQNKKPLSAGPSLPGRRARYWHSTQANWAGVCVCGAAMVSLPATWMDIMDVKAWRPVMPWRKTSLVYFKVMSLGQAPQAILVDPCFANGLGASRNHRQLLTLPHAVKLQGYHVPHLSEGEVYVAFGCGKPTIDADGCVCLALPKCGQRAGVSRVLGFDRPSWPLNTIELFSGGLGGWSRAVSHMPRQYSVKLALDHDLQACKTFAANYNAVVCSGTDSLREILQRGLPVLCMDIEDFRWMEGLLYEPMKVFAASFPCQSWSSLAHQAGTKSTQGRVLLFLIQAIRILQPLAVVMENVAGFRGHSEYELFKTTLEDSGFFILFSTIHDLENLSFSSRRRWLAVIVNSAQIQDFTLLQQWAQPILRQTIRFDPTQHTLDADHSLLRDRLRLQPSELQVMREFPSDRDWMFSCPVGSIAGRTYGQGTLLPTIVASYRKSITFDRTYLKAKGLLAWVIRDCKGEVRWLAAHEAAHALMHPACTILPDDEEQAMFLVGNSISPGQAALMLKYLDVALARQNGATSMLDFPQIIAAIRREMGIMTQLEICEARPGCTTLQRLPHPGRTPQAVCPQCGSPCDYPLVVACPECFLIAGECCRVQHCRPEHNRRAGPGNQGDVEETVLDLQDIQVTFKNPPATARVASRTCPSVSHLCQALHLPVGQWFFRQGLQVNMETTLVPGDELTVLSASRVDALCPQCQAFGMGGRLRVCHACAEVGCLHCIDDRCLPCLGHALHVCRDCHLQAARLRECLDRSEALQKEDAEQQDDWAWARRCTILQQLTPPPSPVPTAPLLAQTDRHRPGPGRDSPSKRPRTQECAPTLQWEPDFESMASSSSTSMTRPRLVDTQALFRGSEDFVGYYDLDGRFHSLDRPSTATTWPQWLQNEDLRAPLHRIWATVNGTRIGQDYLLLPGVPYLLRLHFGLPGGGKATSKGQGKAEPVLKKLAAHLVTKGVPENVAKTRAQEVVDELGVEVINQAYNALDPWSTLKSAAGQRIRLVKQEELRAFKGKPDKAIAAARLPEEDPWVHSDPWKESRAVDAGPELQLVAGTFLTEKDEELPLLQILEAGACGVAVVTLKDAETYAAASVLLSDEELAGVVAGSVHPSTGQLRCEEIAFMAISMGAKVLLKGYLVQFGAKHAKAKPLQHRIKVDLPATTTVAVEIRKEFLGPDDWDKVCHNPLRYATAAIAGLQVAMVSSWAKKFFEERRPADSSHATSWHCFCKIQNDKLDSILPASGKGSVFLTPKEPGMITASGKYRVVWLESLDLDKATTWTRMYPELCGLVRGRSSLGLRTRAQDYATIRHKTEPNWSPRGILTDVIIARRWTVAPLPSLDRQTVQQMVTQLGWKAVPIRQLTHDTWMLGADNQDEPPCDLFDWNGRPVLISEHSPGADDSKQTAVLSAGASFKRQYGRQLSAGKAHMAPSSNPQDAPMSQTSGPRSIFSEFKDNLNGRLQEMQEELQRAVNAVSQKVQEVESQAAASSRDLHQVAADQEQRLNSMESNISSLSASVVTKADLAFALKEAMQVQTQELRGLLSKRPSPEATPTHDQAKALRTN